MAMPPLQPQRFPSPLPNTKVRHWSAGHMSLLFARSLALPIFAPSGESWFSMFLLENARDRKSTRLNSSHVAISYAVFCLKKKNLVTKREQSHPLALRPLMLLEASVVSRPHSVGPAAT